jgi:WD40 repeat protein
MDDTFGSYVNDLAFSPDGSLLASGHTDNTLVFWDVPSRALIGLPIAGFARDVTNIAFTQDGRMLLTGRDDDTSVEGGYTIQFWDVASHQPIGPPLPGNDPNSVYDLALSPDGKYMAAGVWEGVELWEISFASWRRHACQIANRNLSLDEWARFVGDRPYQKTCPELP